MTIFRHYSDMKSVGNVTLTLGVEPDTVDATFDRYNKFTGVTTEETITLTRGQFIAINQTIVANITEASDNLEALNAEKLSIVEFKADALALLL